MKFRPRTLSALILLGTSALPFGTVRAQLAPGTLSCSSGAAMTYMQAMACSGTWSGNDMNQRPAVLDQLQTDFTPFVGAGSWWAYSGTTSFTGSTSGTVDLGRSVTGYFAVALKSSTRFSFYLFDGGTAGLSSVAFETNGTSVNRKGNPQGLSHATLYVAENNSVSVTSAPEPASALLLITGMAAVVFARRRYAAV